MGFPCTIPCTPGARCLLQTFPCFLTYCPFIVSPGNECPEPQPPVHGKIEPLQTTYSFKDQVLISCDTGYKMLKVQGPAGGGRATRPEECSRASQGQWASRACHGPTIGFPNFPINLQRVPEIPVLYKSKACIPDFHLWKWHRSLLSELGLI